MAEPCRVAKIVETCPGVKIVETCPGVKIVETCHGASLRTGKIQPCKIYVIVRGNCQPPSAG